ncbi:MAG: hydrogenase maturation protease [Planctomycetes bacterium]|nr:hydrogenase maturation protease [Planctomycetota bacterium]
MKTLLLGLGNTIVSDDGVGIRIARELKELLSKYEIDVIEACLAGFDILDIVDGYERLIIIDSIKTQGGKPGDLYRLAWDELSADSCPVLFHGLNLHTVIELGRELGCRLPEEIMIFAVEILDNTTISEEHTEAVEQQIPTVVQQIYQEVISEMAES